MKYKIVNSAVQICAPGRRAPEGSSVSTEIGKLLRHQDIRTSIKVEYFLDGVKHRVKTNNHSSAQAAPPVREEKSARVPKKSYKLLLYSVVVIAILFVLLKTMFSVEEETLVTTMKPRFRVCLTLFGNAAVEDAQSPKTFFKE